MCLQAEVAISLILSLIYAIYVCRHQLDHVLDDQSLKAVHNATKLTRKQAVNVKVDIAKLKQQTSGTYC